MIFERAAVVFGLDFDFCFNTGWLNASLPNRTDEQHSKDAKAQVLHTGCQDSVKISLAES